MGKIVLAEENLLHYLKTISRTDSIDIGVVIGQSTDTIDYVIHMVRIKKEDGDPVMSFKSNSMKNIKNMVPRDYIDLIKEKLPGGLTVLGIFICSSFDIFNELHSKYLALLVYNIRKTSKEKGPFDLPGGIYRYIFHYNTVTQKYVCKYFTVNPEPVEWKFQENCTKWCQISCKFCLNILPIFCQNKMKLNRELMKFLNEMTKTVCNSAVMVGGKLLHEDQDIQSIINAKGQKKVVNGTEIRFLEASIYTPVSQVPIKISSQERVFASHNKILMEGIVKSETFVSQSATTEDVIEAVKFDILNSLSTRIRLHLDSLTDEEDEKFDSDETIHQLPRRISVSITNSPFCFFDYIFPEEVCQEIIKQSKVWLNEEVTLNDVNELYEGQWDLSKFHDSNPKEKDLRYEDDLLSSTLPTGFLIAAISFAVILIAIAVALKMQGTASLDGNPH